MFSPVQVDHATALARVLEFAGRIDRRQVADAFLASLSTRRLDWRSALGSFATFQHASLHNVADEDRRCAVCGFYLNVQSVDLNLLNFERLKWGGVRHDHVNYAVLDLGLFLDARTPQPTTRDISIFRDLLAAIEAVPPGVSSAALHTYFPKSLKGNKTERDVIVGILGYCGLLGTARHPGYSDAFVPVGARELPHRRYVDMAYPACWWRSDDGVNQRLLAEYFGHVL
jgi:hypothetical protein